MLMARRLPLLISPKKGAKEGAVIDDLFAGRVMKGAEHKKRSIGQGTQETETEFAYECEAFLLLKGHLHEKCR